MAGPDDTDEELMGSTFRSTGAVLAIACILGACGSDSTATTTLASAQTESSETSATDVSTTVAIAVTTTEAETTSAPVTTIATTSTAAPVELAAICPLVAPELVAGVLGAPSTDAGTETVFEPTYKSCRWLTDPGSGNSNSLEIAVLVRKSPSSAGFSPLPDIGSPVPVDGVGDAATYSNNGQTGFEIAQLVADDALIALSITLNYGGTTPHGDDLEGAVAEIARQIFGQLSG
jgi:hypothetical protein